MSERSRDHFGTNASLESPSPAIGLAADRGVLGEAEGTTCVENGVGRRRSGCRPSQLCSEVLESGSSVEPAEDPDGVWPLCRPSRVSRDQVVESEVRIPWMADPGDDLAIRWGGRHV